LSASCQKQAEAAELAGSKKGAQANALIISGLSTKVTALQSQVQELEKSGQQLTKTIEELNGEIEILRIIVSFLNTTKITQSGNVVEDTTISIFTFFNTIILLFSILCGVGFIAPYFYRKGKEEVELAVAERQQDIYRKAQATRQITKAAPKTNNPYAVPRPPVAPNTSSATTTRGTATEITIPLENTNLSMVVPKSKSQSPAKRRPNNSNSSLGGKRRTRKHKKYVTKRRQLRKIRRTGKKRHRNSKKFRMNK
jgi:hypothetical protein